MAAAYAIATTATKITATTIESTQHTKITMNSHSSAAIDTKSYYKIFYASTTRIPSLH